MNETIYVEADAGSTVPATLIGGLTLLERKLREAERCGAKRAVVACDGPLPANTTLTIERVAPGSPPPEGALVVRADELCGVRIVSSDTRREAERKLYRSLQTSYQGPMDTLVNRHFSLRLTRLLARTSVTPNQITLLALVLGVLSAYFIAALGRSGLWWGAGLLFTQWILDSCDGEIARLKFQFSRIGQWLDNVCDDVTDASLLVAFGIAAQRQSTLVPWGTIGMVAAGFRLFSQGVLYASVLKLGDFNKFRWWFEAEKKSIDDVYDWKSPLTWVRSLGRRDVIVFSWVVLSAANFPTVALVYGALIATQYLVMTLLHLLLR